MGRLVGRCATANPPRISGWSSAERKLDDSRLGIAMGSQRWRNLAPSSGNPIVTRFRVRLATRRLEKILRLYDYGVFHLVRTFEGKLSWTGLGLPEDFERKDHYYEVVATAEV